MKKSLWLEVTQDEYELPLVVAESSFQLGEMVGIKGDEVRSLHSKWQNGKTKTCRFRRVDYLEDDE